MIALGGWAAQVFTLKNAQTDSMMAEIAAAFNTAETGNSRNPSSFGDRYKHFLIRAMSASDAVVAKLPQALSVPLAHWFKAVNYMNVHKNQKIAGGQRVGNAGKPIADKNYGELMP